LTILLTGGAGYIGSHVAHRLVDAGQTCVIVDNLSTGSGENIPASIPLLVGSIEDGNFVSKVIRDHQITSVMHFAGCAIVDESVRDPLKYFRTNVSGTIALLQACVSEGVRKFIFSSSAAVYGRAQEVPVSETAPRSPASPYGWSKLMAEIAIEKLGAAGHIDFVVLRYFNVAGGDPQLRTGQRSKHATHLIKVASEVASGRREYLPVYGTDYPTADGTCVRDFIHVWDLAELHIAALEYLLRGKPSATFNCGYGRGFSVLEVARAFAHVLGRALPMQWHARRDGDVPVVVSNATLARSVLGWTPRFASIDAIVESALAWERRLSGTSQ
jgi:UDP-glucose 4-epimerase